MKTEYDFSKAIKNPYAAKLKQQITINIDGDVIAYFKSLAEQTGVPYQTLINLYLTDCMKSNKHPTITWQ